MVIRLMPHQIPAYWEAIKYAAVNADRVEDEFVGKYTNRLLYVLLNGKAQCFIGFSDERILQRVAITRIVTDEVRDEKTLFVNCLYSFEIAKPEVWISEFEFIKAFARSIGCKTITSWTTSKRAEEINRLVGMKDRFKSFICEV